MTSPADLVAALSGKQVVSFTTTYMDVDVSSEVELDSGQVSLIFADGTRATFSAVWHNDSTAGLYLYVSEAVVVEEPQ